MVVLDITALVESRTMVNHKYYRRGSAMILQQQCCQVTTAFLKSVSLHWKSQDILEAVESGYYISGSQYI